MRGFKYIQKGPNFVRRGDNNEIILMTLKSYSLKPLGQFLLNLAQKSLGMGNLTLFQGEIMAKIAKIH